jgi:hypothetical protein
MLVRIFSPWLYKKGFELLNENVGLSRYQKIHRSMTGQIPV